MSNTPANHQTSNSANLGKSNSADNSLEVEIHVDANVDLPTDEVRCVMASRLAAAHRGFTSGEIGIRVCNDAEIQLLNRQHLQHDYPTDVISWTYSNDLPILSGDLVVGIETAHRRAQEFGWPIEHEVLLYIVHGTLHLTGMNDKSPEQRAQMRESEQAVMVQLGVTQIDRYSADRPRRPEAAR